MRTCAVLIGIALAACATTSSEGPAGGGSPGGSGGTGAAEPGALAPLLAPMRAAHRVPALGAAILDADGLVAIGVTGMRKDGGPRAVTVDDAWHLGSDTKAMTATLVGMFVDEGELDWDMTIPEAFPRLLVHAAWNHVTLEDLLRHRSGMGDAGEHPDWWNEMWQATDPVAQRAAFAAEVFAVPPDHTVGEYAYSNFNYVAAGAALEAVSGESWEELMRTRLFQPLGMTSCGFGAPGTAGKVDAPWGHQGAAGSYVPMDPGDLGADNPATLGPAGTAHCALADFGKFGLDHLAGAKGRGRLLSAASYARLHTPPAEGGYAGGWGVGEDPTFGGRVLAHDGSNTLWYARIIVAIDAGRVYLVVANAADAEAQAAVGEAAAALPGF